MAEGPFSSEHIQYTFSGGLPGGEIWSCGLRTLAATATEAQLQEFAQKVGVAFKTMWESTGSILQINPAGVTFLKTTARLIGTDGKALIVAEDNTGHSVSIGPAQGAPNQTALVASLLTNKAGRTGRGRMYLPMLSPNFTSGQDRLPSSIVNPVATAVAAMITDIATITADGSSSGPFPIAIQSRATPPTAAVVTKVAVGDVADTQRRRRDKIIEVYTTVLV